MKKIELEQWEPFPGDPRRMQYAGQRVAQEVFEELKHRLESMGYLPDEYFLWHSGRTSFAGSSAGNSTLTGLRSEEHTSELQSRI